MSSPVSRVRIGVLFVLMALAVLGCQTLPGADVDRLPTVVTVADASPERATLNTRVYDAATEKVTGSFYQRDYGGVDWLAEVAERRAEAIAQPDEASFYRTLNETLALLNDEHTRALRPGVNLRRTQARIGSVPSWGMGIAHVDDSWIVTRIRQGGPATPAGVQIGWRLDAVDGLALDPFRDDASAAFRYDASKPRLFRFTDAADGVHEISLTPVALPRSLGEMHRRPDGVLVVYFTGFDRPTRNWLLMRLREELADPPRAIVIDLRDNHGGRMTEVGRLLSPFFAERRQFGTTEFRIFPDRHHWTRSGDLTFNGPLAVLTSPGSASGAEVYAAAVQEAGRGLIVGRPTAGAVVGSLAYALPDGGRLSVGMVSFRTGGGAVLEHVGVTPDISARAAVADLRAGRDTALEVAVSALLQP